MTDSNTGLRKACLDEDTDVDHYFLPGGILDTPSHEEDMIGGSLLNEIGGMGNVTMLVPPNQMGVIRIGGAEAHMDGSCSGAALARSQNQSKPTSAAMEGQARLSVEGTNPMAKEFTPAARPVPADIAINTRPGLGGSHSRPSLLLASEPRYSNRFFSAAVGSEMKKPVVEAPVGVVGVPQEVRGELRQNARYQPGTSWATRAIAFPPHSGSPLAANEMLTIDSQGHRSSPEGLATREVIPQVNDRISDRGKVEIGGACISQSKRRELGAITHHGRSHKSVQSTDGALYPPEITKFDVDGDYFSGRQQRRRNRIQRSLLRESHSDDADRSNDADPVAKTSQMDARVPDIVIYQGKGRDRRIDENYEDDQDSETKPTTRSRIKIPSVVSPNAPQARHIEHLGQEAGGQTQKKSARHGFVEKDLPRSRERENSAQEILIPKSAEGRNSKASSDGSLASSIPTGLPGHREISQDQASPRLILSPFTNDEGDEGDFPVDGVVDETAEQWPDGATDRGPQQVHKDESSLGNCGKPKSRKKEERYANRSGPKHLLGVVTKDSSRVRGKLGPRLSSSRNLSALGASFRNFLLGVSAAAASATVRIISLSLGRLRLVGRLLALFSLSASVGAWFLSVVMAIMSWLLMLWLRVHSLALKEATGNIHVAFCFLFPYSFQYMVSLMDEWAPHWLPACLWYSFLMQMLCTSNHLHKNSMSFHVVPALRALLPVAFLCEVPSGRSYLLALEGSELLLLSFSLAAVRLRCLFSPIFLFSWSSQVIAIATFGSCSSLQYVQLLVSLASLHAVSIVDVTLNSRFYHARYRAGISLTNGFRSIPPSSLTLLC